ncbi:MAG: tRNA 2-thiouridine(34) synthase MnmA [Clostridia bacterium]|nr:tRNA 2-thiouridine(34) synthase MnmA [Clostridia bacterium]
MAKALIAMSGGVDSSVAALLTKNAGYECVGCTMRLFTNEDAGVQSRTCCSLNDVEDARSVACRLGMPYYVFNFSDDFRKQVIGKFIDCYFAGATPNPCIDCNRYMKFGKLCERAEILGCDVIVTGHYARIEKSGGRFLLKKGLDACKDQSYVLYAMTQAELSRTLLPLGGLHKSEVRAVAAENGFLNADKPDSQDICFVPDGDYAAAIERFSDRVSPPGDFIDAEGRVLGKHKGIIHYTVGQRRRLGISIGSRCYVSAIDPEKNTVTLTAGEGLFTNVVTVRDVNWIACDGLGRPEKLTAKLRYRHPAQPAVVEQTGEDTVRLTFDTPQRAATRGQAAVFYDGDTVVGGGTIA